MNQYWAKIKITERDTITYTCYATDIKKARTLAKGFAIKKYGSAKIVSIRKNH